jgi:L-histidine N-alpha-methyltransferase
MTAAAAQQLRTSEPMLVRGNDRMRRDVLEALARRPVRELPTQYLYDERGSALFDRICELPEYYPTRTELSIMERNVEAMAHGVGERALLVEYGSGSSIKTRRLLEELKDPAGCVLVDISREHLLRSAARLAAELPHVEVLPVVADFTAPFAVPRSRKAPQRRVLFFPGSTIGNFLPEQATRLMQQMATQAGIGGGLLIGTDLRKDPAVLEAAYADEAGVTAAFNKNLLRRINRELGADFDLRAFEHRAIYDQERGRIEMHLVSRRAQTVRLAGRRFELVSGESIRTEYSHKYTIDGFHELAAEAGWRPEEVWTDAKAWFAVHLLRRA